MDNGFVILNPNYPTLLSLQYTQPLWRNLRYDSRRHLIEVASKNSALTAARLRRQVMELIDQTEQAYWDLYFWRRELEVQNRALQLAAVQEETSRRQVSLGQLAAIEVTAAQTQVASFELNLLSTSETLARAENRLKELILPDRGSPLWRAELQTTSEPDLSFAEPPLADAITRALAERPEVEELDVSVKTNQADQRYYREEQKPQLDLVGRYTAAGLAGVDVSQNSPSPLASSLTPALARLNQLSALAGLSPVALGAGATVPSLLIGDYGTSLNRLFRGNFPTTFGELRLTLPLRNRTAVANLQLAVIEGNRLEQRGKAVGQQIESQVRSALQSIASARQRLEVARARRRSSEEQYQSEERRFRTGASTLFLVQQRQLNLVNAATQVHRAEADLAQAVAHFERVRGNNYERHGIVLK